MVFNEYVFEIGNDFTDLVIKFMFVYEAMKDNWC